jgi:predicted transcriptional regulator
MRNGSRLSAVSRARAVIARVLVRTYGLTKAETARYLGVTPSGAVKILQRSRRPSADGRS